MNLYLKKQWWKIALAALGPIVISQIFFFLPMRAALREVDVKPDLQALQQNPNDVAAHRKVAKKYMNRREYDLAVQHYKEVIRLAPSQNKSRFKLALCLARMGKRDEATSEMEKAVQINDEGGFLARQYLPRLRNQPDSLVDRAWLKGKPFEPHEGRKQTRPNSAMKGNP